MGIGFDVVLALRTEGHDAIHLAELGFQRMPDDAILELAASQARVVLAHDLDMGRFLAISRATSPSVITFRLADMRPISVLPHLRQALSALQTELHQGAIVTVTDSGARCHLLPILPK